jgi:hypothetical protein
MVEGEWLNGVPHGICIIESHDGRGVMVFTHGKPDGGPCWAEIKDEDAIVSAENGGKVVNRGIMRLYKN